MNEPDREESRLLVWVAAAYIGSKVLPRLLEWLDSLPPQSLPSPPRPLALPPAKELPPAPLTQVPVGSMVPPEKETDSIATDLEALLRGITLHGPTPSSVPVSPTVEPLPPDQQLVDLVNHPSVVLIAGHRGSGKTALAFRLQELLRLRAAPYAIGLPVGVERLLPDWYGLAGQFSDIPPNAVVYVPEAYRLFHARSAHASQGQNVGDMVNISRHRRHTLIFDVQNLAHLDRNVMSEADVIFVKEPGPFQAGFERPQLRSIFDAARAAFAGVNLTRRKRVACVFAPGRSINGVLMENSLPSFWTDTLSHAFGRIGPDAAGQGGTLPRGPARESWPGGA